LAWITSILIVAGHDAVDGTPFGRYRLVELLGRGGMGEVWRAYDTSTDRVVAIKVLPQHLADDQAFVQRFRREAHTAARLDSPHVVPIHTYGEIDGRLYVDMRLINGRDLNTVLAGGPLSPARAVRIIEQIAEALHAAHEIGLMHRDVKPSNILLDKNDFAYLIDFGIARAAEDTKLTSTGSMIGTLQYVAPERLRSGSEVDARADVYALACVLYECLTGSPPFPGNSPELLMMAHLSTPPPQPSTGAPEVPDQFDEVIATGMAKDPDQRYATTVELASAARDAITNPIPRPEPSPPPVTATEPASVPAASPTIPAQHRTPPPGNLYASAPTQQGPPVEVSTQRQEPFAERPSPSIPPARAWWRRKAVVISAASVATIAAIVAAITLATNENQPARQSSPPAASEPRQTTAPGLTTAPPPAPRQATLPFTGLSLQNGGGVAVDGKGTVYVADYGNKRVVALPAGSTAQTVLPFTGLRGPSGVAVDAAGNVYVADSSNSRVLKLAAGSDTQTELPLTQLTGFAAGIAVDTAGNLYAGAFDANCKGRVLQLAAGSNTQTLLPFTGLCYPIGVAVDAAGNVYVTSLVKVLKLAAGSNTQTELPLTVGSAAGVAVDAAGAVYVADAHIGSDRVVKLAAGSNTQTVLPFTDLAEPSGLAVDAAGNIYVGDSKKNRVLKLPAQ
jgi:serine/threonine-protein kinase